MTRPQGAEPRILALETSTTRGGVALAIGGELVGLVVADLAGRASGRLLADAAELLEAEGLGPRDVTAFAASLGPGSFTGLRVGLSSAKALAWATGGALVGASSLETLAAGEQRPGLIAPVLDARRSEVYGALFRREPGGGLVRLHEDVVATPDAWAEALAEAMGDAPAVVLGDGQDRYRETFAGRLGDRMLEPNPETPRHPSPGALALLGGARLAAGEVLDAEAAEPNYVRSHGAVPPRDMRRKG